MSRMWCSTVSKSTLDRIISVASCSTATSRILDWISRKGASVKNGLYDFSGASLWQGISFCKRWYAWHHFGCQWDELMGDPRGGVVLEVSAYMTRNVTTLRNDSHLLDAALLIRRTGKRHVPILDENGKLVGIISDRDVSRLSPSML